MYIQTCSFSKKDNSTWRGERETHPNYHDGYPKSEVPSAVAGSATSFCVARNDRSARIVMHRHLVERSPFQLHFSATRTLSMDVEGMELEVLESHDWDRFRPRFVAVEWLEPLSVKETISSGVSRFLQQQKYDLISKTPATLIFWESETADSRIR
jgi:hypothetical protein